jgi:hypothetical protein
MTNLEETLEKIKMTIDQYKQRLREIVEARDAATQKEGGWCVEDGTYPDRYGTNNAIGTNVCVYSRADATLIALAANTISELAENQLRLVEACEKISCGCSIRERMSGHLLDCELSYITEALSSILEEK